MNDQRELDRLLDAFFVDGTDELPDRVIDAALDQIDHTHQRQALRLPRRFQTMPMLTRVAAAAAIGALAVGATFYLLQGPPPGAGDPDAGPSDSQGPSEPATTPGATATPVPIPTAKPSPMSLTGATGAGRQIHTATALADGRVLVAGGFDYQDLELGSATLIGDGASTATGSLADPRGYHTSTLLEDGRVLIAGGGNASWTFVGHYLASAELYDPTSGTFTATGSMTTTRTLHTATLLSDGRVLVIGGNDANTRTTASAELYDPATGTFSPTGSMATARGMQTATLLADGRVLVVGGAQDPWTFSKPFLTSAEIYDPASGTFTPTGHLEFPRAGHTATLLADGRVLIAGGGSTPSSGFTSAELYDPATGTFTLTGRMADARIYHTATLLADGRVLVTGGGGNYGTRDFLASAELYDPGTGTFSVTGSMAEARTYHAATLVGGGRVLVTGGYGDLAPLASAEMYDPTTGTFSPVNAGG